MKSKQIFVLLLLLLSFVAVSHSQRNLASNKMFAIYWCGFSGNYCGQSTSDDVYEDATHVIMAFANANKDGTLSHGSMPTSLIKQWHNEGKKVILSIGGQEGHLYDIFQNPSNFVSSIYSIMSKYSLDGVDLDLEDYGSTPKQVITTLQKMRAKFGTKYEIFFTAENVTVYPSSVVSVPSVNTGGQFWNYMVPVLNQALQYIDYVQ
ncbi:Glycoside hydrolase, superfamily [Pseudocohnilembus persalinus]|uniref:Glycoside hydrolase, superfamily n=1 Tax=Pseudocohnilembus persalinus TaxID=266149 RepID=A0A0V0QWB4_PSEPJ|nr:Glycoside hydrolase, superfamily [Pseudocohnilembus persalinus]|eukprot:KRX06465.1 Glycoside hydrolase, superfamily [Pseudocohnilembus persalinus]